VARFLAPLATPQIYLGASIGPRPHQAMIKIKPALPSPCPEFRTPGEVLAARDKAQSLKERIYQRRKRHLQALRACTPQERQFLRALAEHRYQPYAAAKAVQISNRMAGKIMQRSRVREAMELFLEDALDQTSVSHASLVADLVEIKERCLQARPIQDASGKQVFVRLRSGKVAAAYSFDARGAVQAVKELADLMKLAPAKRVEVRTLSVIATATAHVANTLQNLNDPNAAALEYQQLMYGNLPPVNDDDSGPYDQVAAE
jgi:hypothetical protein